MDPLILPLAILSIVTLLCVIALLRIAIHVATPAGDVVVLVDEVRTAALVNESVCLVRAITSVQNSGLRIRN